MSGYQGWPFRAIDWAEWSREAVTRLQERNDAWTARFAVAERAPYHWDLHRGALVLERAEDVVVADLLLVGTASAATGTFRWAWADPALPTPMQRRLDEVRSFGHEHDLKLLVDAEWPGGRAEGLEMLAVAGRVLDAEGSWVDEQDGTTVFMLLSRFRVERVREAPPSDAADGAADA